MFRMSCPVAPSRAPSRRAVLGGLGALLAGTTALGRAPALAHTQTVHGQGGGMTLGFDPAYVRGAVEPFARTTLYAGERLTWPMIGPGFSKEAAIPPHLWGMLYDDWRPAMEEEGLSVFLQGLENRGPDNARKRIYTSALTPDLYERHYRPKVARFLERLFDPAHEGEPLMARYYEDYWDLYWDLHLGVRDDAIPPEVREIGNAFNAVIGFWDPRSEEVYRAYMRVRELRPGLRDWIDARLQDILDGNVENPEATIAHYWLVNGGGGENFRREDVVFECFHNFLAFSQWGNTLYRIMDRLDRENGDAAVRDAFDAALADPDVRDEDGPFTRLDRLTMELFRTISPNTGSLSTLAVAQEEDEPVEHAFILHPHPETSDDPRHWEDPQAFDPDRYLRVPTSAQIDEEACAGAGLARCPFSLVAAEMPEERDVLMRNSGFGTVFATVEGRDFPVVDHAGFAPFGFGYRRCAGEWLTIDFFNDVLRKIHAESIVFARAEVDEPERLPVGPVTVIEDDIAFERA
ncbi:hypothetical protein [Salinarimonas sp.]|uniref:hypothetical protein n=1 Tax=Salinarimonas sp. TaxID=2766526 RepID=UPI00391A50EC